jgi:hypothetical protein
VNDEPKTKMKYKITITKVETIQATEPGEFTTIEERPWTQDELNSERAACYGDFSGFLEKTPLKKVFGYSPRRTVDKQIETEVLKQTVEELDLPAVIKAVNGL